MTPPPPCPTCSEVLVAQADDTLRCAEGHGYTVVGLALTTNVAALRALWLAIRALEDDASTLRYMAEHYEGQFGAGQPAARREEAAAALDAAHLLRTHALQAQARLDNLPIAPSAVREDNSERGRGG